MLKSRLFQPMLVPITPLIDHTTAAIVLKGMIVHMLVHHIFKVHFVLLLLCDILTCCTSAWSTPTRCRRRPAPTLTSKPGRRRAPYCWPYRTKHRHLFWVGEEGINRGLGEESTMLINMFAGVGIWTLNPLSLCFAWLCWIQYEWVCLLVMSWIVVLLCTSLFEAWRVVKTNIFQYSDLAGQLFP